MSSNKENFLRLRSLGFSLDEAFAQLDITEESKLNEKVSPYLRKKSTVTVEATKETATLSDNRRRMTRSLFIDLLIEKTPGISRTMLGKLVRKEYPDKMGSLSSYLCNAANGTGYYHGTPRFRRVWDSVIGDYRFYSV